MSCPNCYRNTRDLITCNSCKRSACEDCWTEENSASTASLFIAIARAFLGSRKRFRCPYCGNGSPQRSGGQFISINRDREINI